MRSLSEQSVWLSGSSLALPTRQRQLHLISMMYISNLALIKCFPLKHSEYWLELLNSTLTIVPAQQLPPLLARRWAAQLPTVLQVWLPFPNFHTTCLETDWPWRDIYTNVWNTAVLFIRLGHHTVTTLGLPYAVWHHVIMRKWCEPVWSNIGKMLQHSGTGLSM